MITNDIPVKKSFGFRCIVWVVVFLLFVMFLTYREQTGAGVVDGMKSALHTVMPSTFPYLVLTYLLIESGFPEFIGEKLSFLSRIFKIPPSCFFVLPLSMICGFPTGGAVVGELYSKGMCSKNEGERMIAFCNFCGPPYVLSVLGGGVMKDIRLGIIAYIVQSIMAVVFGIVLACFENSEGTPENTAVKNSEREKGFAQMFCTSVCKAGEAFFRILFYIVFFGGICRVCKTMLPFVSQAVFGFFEISIGMQGIMSVQNRGAAYIIGCFLVYFSGFSVHAQVSSCLPEGLSLKKYMLVRFIFAPVSTLLAFLTAWVFGLVAL